MNIYSDIATFNEVLQKILETGKRIIDADLKIAAEFITDVIPECSNLELLQIVYYKKGFRVLSADHRFSVHFEANDIPQILTDSDSLVKHRIEDIESFYKSRSSRRRY